MADYKHIVRVANTDLDGAKPIHQALRKIRGLGFMLSNAVCKLSDVNLSQKAGTLDEGSIRRLTETVLHPLSAGVPRWMVNRRVDPASGEDKHLLSTDIKFVQENDKKLMAMTKSYKGKRHQIGIPVRGQRTKSNFRRNKGKVQGVKRSKATKKGK